jgi:glycosyltransferase involved in cell wall biosynthesis
MRILAITQCFPRPGQPGFCLPQAHQMRQLARRHELRLIVPVSWRHRLASRRVDSDIVYPTYWYPPGVLRHLHGHFYLASVRGAVRKTIENFRPEVVLAFWAHPDGWAAVRIARELGVPAVVKVIGSDVLVVARDRRRRDAVAGALGAADRVIAVSRDLARSVVELGVDGEKVHVVPQGIDMELFTRGDRAAARAALGISADTRMILFVGNLLFSKGVGILIEACARLAKRNAAFSCYLVGRGRDEAKLRKMAEGLSAPVVFAGRCSQSALVNWYRAADLVTLPSFSEGIPNVLREALQCGRPFVATRVGGIPEISDPTVSRLITPGDPGELADALGTMLDSPPTVDPSIADRFNITWARSADMVAHHLGAANSAGSEVSAADQTELAIR